MQSISQNSATQIDGKNGLVYKTCRTVSICFAFVVMGLYTEIVGSTAPDLKLQLRLYESHESYGLGATIGSLAIIFGSLFVFSTIVFLNFKTKCSLIFNYGSKIDFMLSISFFCAAAGALLLPFARNMGIELFYASCALIGFAQGILLVGASLVLVKTWYRRENNFYTDKLRFIVMMCYSLGALLAAFLTKLFLVPITYDYRDYYRDSMADSRNYLKVLEATTSAAATTTTTLSRSNTTTPRPRVPTRPTTRPTTTTVKPLPDLIILDFLRYDSSDLYDENDTLHRVFAQHFFYIYYIVSSVCALAMVTFLVFYVIELRASSKANQSEHHELGSSDNKSSNKVTQDDRLSAKKRLANFLNEKLNFNLVNLIPGNKRTPLDASNQPQQQTTNTSIYLWNCLILLFLSFFHAFTYGSHKIQANYLTSYAIQTEYLRKTLQNNEIMGFEAKTAFSNWSNILSFTESYIAPSMSLIQANYLLIAYYSGIFFGSIVNVILISPFVAKYFTIKPIVLAYVNCLMHLASRMCTLIFAAVLISNDSFKSSTWLIWLILSFLNGLFMAPLPALVYEYLSGASSNIQFSVLSNNLSVVELISLSTGMALFQLAIGFSFDSSQTCNSFVNIGFVNAIAMVVCLALVHLVFKYVPRKYRLVSPS